MSVDNRIPKNPVNPSVLKGTPSVAPGVTSTVATNSAGVGSAPDVASDAAALRRMEGPRPFRLPAVLAAVTPAERKLPGGSTDAAWGRLAEFGDQADRAATLVAYRHGML
jgi:hypothetical protein